MNRLDREEPSPVGEENAAETDRGVLLGRIIFWLLFLYAAGFTVMVFEDILNHTFL